MSKLTPPSEKTDEDGDFEEVTETRIVGVTETGVIRKRSVKRRVSKHEKAKLQGYGNCTEEYNKIRNRIMKSRMVVDSVEALKERFKMIQLMYNDCRDLTHKWEETREMRIKSERRRDLESILISLASLLIIVLLAFHWLFF